MKRRGFTIVELLAVLAVIALLMALLMPAVQQAREASRRLQCRNNLKQLGLALHQYHDVHGCVPPPAMGVSTDDAFGWSVSLLPQLDQSALYGLLSPLTEQWVALDHFQRYGKIVSGADTILSVFQCPSSSLPQRSEQVGPGILPPYALGYARSDYRGSRGPDDQDGLFVSVRYSGISALRFADVTDGLSNTLAIGEASYPGQAGNQWPSWAVSPLSHYPWVFSSIRVCGINRVPSFAGKYWVNVPDHDCAISMHRGIAHFLMADGSVRALSENIDEKVYESLGSRNDGRVFDSQ